MINRREIKIFLTFFLIYSFFVQWSTWNEESRFALTRAIVDEKRFEIDSFYNRTGDRSYYNGHYYTDKSPGTSFIATPVYYIGKSILNPTPAKDYIIYYTHAPGGTIPIVYPFYDSATQLIMFMITVFSSSIFSALTVVLIYKISKYFCKEEKYRVLIVIISGLATLIFPVALLFWSHAFAMFLSFLSFYLLFVYKESPKHLLLSGVLLGYAISSSSFAILLLVCYLFYLFLLREKKFYLFLLGISLGLLPLIFYNYFVFDSIQVTRGPLDTDVWGDIQNMEVWPGLSRALLTAIKLLFYPERGLFFYSPILILVLFGIRPLFKKHKLELFLTTFIFLIFLATTAMRYFWFSGITFGSRDFVFMIPFLTIPLIYSIQKINLKIVYTLLLLSIFFNFLGLQALESLSLHSSATDLSKSKFIPDLEKFYFFYNRNTNIDELGDQILNNPLFEYYLPLFLRNGPRSRIFESLLNSIIENRLSVDIRYMSHLPTSTDRYLKYNQLAFLCLVPLSVVLCLIWKKEILNSL